MDGSVGIIAAFAAGIVSFLSPCVLPLFPVYISFMTGMTLGELTAEDRTIGRILVPVLLFVAGFPIVFVAMGAGASVLGTFLREYRDVLDRIVGLVLLVFGIVLLDVIPLSFLHGGGLDAARFRKFGPAAAFVFGLAFPFAMGPCAGPVYGAILTLAISRDTVGQAAGLLFVYSLGLAVPFVAASLLLGRMGGALKWLSRHAKSVNRLAGALLVLIGVILLSGQMQRVSAFLNQVLPSIEL